jgi:hypothetical protein
VAKKSPTNLVFSALSKDNFADIGKSVNVTVGVVEFQVPIYLPSSVSSAIGSVSLRDESSSPHENSIKGIIKKNGINEMDFFMLNLV